jgi:aminoglycoside 6'-N-acetyltransferase I
MQRMLDHAIHLRNAFGRTTILWPRRCERRRIASRIAIAHSCTMIRAVTRDDFAEWRRMRATLWPDCPPEMHDVEMAEQIGSSEFAVFVHERGHGALGGFIELSVRHRVDGTMSPRVGYVEGWYVDSDLRGKGIGRALMGNAETWARRMGFTELASDAELENEDSIRAHGALGFRETFRLVHFVKSLG